MTRVTTYSTKIEWMSQTMCKFLEGTEKGEEEEEKGKREEAYVVHAEELCGGEGHAGVPGHDGERFEYTVEEDEGHAEDG